MHGALFIRLPLAEGCSEAIKTNLDLNEDFIIELKFEAVRFVR